MNKLTRTITPEVRIIDAKRGLVDYVASDATLDCYREVVIASGWRFSRFAKNAPFCNSHSYYSIDDLLGRVTSFEVTGDQLIERVQWAIDVEENKLAKFGFSMTEKGYLKAVSVGFCPTRAVTPYDPDPKGFQDAIRLLKLSPEDAAKVRRIFLEQEQIELSACIIGANPSALAKAYIDGAATDEDFASIGLGDDGLDFIQRAAASFDGLDLVNQDRVSRHIAKMARPTTLSGNNRTKNASSSNGPDAGEEAMQRERAEFLTSFKALTGLAQ